MVHIPFRYISGCNIYNLQIFRMIKQKLQDVLQEREGASSYKF